MSKRLTNAVSLVVEHLRELNRDPRLSTRECLGRARMLTAHDIRVTFMGKPDLRDAFLEVIIVTDAEIEAVIGATG